jgi:putative transposase
MLRPPHVDEAGGLHHALNRGRLDASICHKDANFEAFEQVSQAALRFNQLEMYSVQLISNHYRLVS